MTFFPVRNIKYDILKNEVETTLDPTDFYCMDKKYRYTAPFIFLKEVSYANPQCICLIINTVKTHIVKYY